MSRIFYFFLGTFGAQLGQRYNATIKLSNEEWILSIYRFIILG